MFSRCFAALQHLFLDASKWAQHMRPYKVEYSIKNDCTSDGKSKGRRNLENDSSETIHLLTGGVTDTNRPLLKGLLEEYGAGWIEVVDFGIIGDRESEVGLVEYYAESYFFQIFS